MFPALGLYSTDTYYEQHLVTADAESTVDGLGTDMPGVWILLETCIIAVVRI